MFDVGVVVCYPARRWHTFGGRRIEGPRGGDTAASQTLARPLGLIYASVAYTMDALTGGDQGWNSQGWETLLCPTGLREQKA